MSSSKPWSNPANLFEPQEDRALRQELRDLLGMATPVATPAAPSPDLLALADTLQREAQRRRHTAPRPTPRRLLLVAALPLAAVLAGLGWWGGVQKQRADQMAAAIQQKEREMDRLAREARASSAELARERQARESVQLQLAQVKQPKGKKGEPFLVLPVANPTKAEPDTVSVKGKP